MGAISKDLDRPTEIKERLRLWDRGQIHELVDRVTAAACKEREHMRAQVITSDEEAEDLLRKGASAKQTASAGALSKAMQKFVGAPAAGGPYDAPKHMPRGVSSRLAADARS